MAQTDSPMARRCCRKGIGGPADWTSPQGLASTLQIMLLLTVVSLAPAILLMTTGLRADHRRAGPVAAGARHAAVAAEPGDHVDRAVHDAAADGAGVERIVREGHSSPYTNSEIGLERGVRPGRCAGATSSWRTRFSGPATTTTCTCSCDTCRSRPTSRRASRRTTSTTKPGEGEREVPLVALLPAFMLSELKTAFLIGFQIYLPFVILDIVVASVTISMGMLMLPPVLISLPFKLLLFVLVDGWHLVVEMLLESFHVIYVADARECISRKRSDDVRIRFDS